MAAEGVSTALYVLEEPIQYAALTWMASLYAYKIYSLLKKPFPPEFAELKGDRTSGALYSLSNVLRPWDMESTEKNLGFYAQFMIFHIAVAVTIGSTFIIPLWPQLMTPFFAGIIMVFMIAAFLIGLYRIFRRLTAEEMKIISSFDDHFAIWLMTAFFGVGALTMWQWIGARANLVQNSAARDFPLMWLFFLMTTFFLIYVPFSKISHYVLYPFGRVNFGKIFGGRGVIKKNNPNITWDPS
jgi:hypothetical protein